MNYQRGNAVKSLLILIVIAGVTGTFVYNYAPGIWVKGKTVVRDEIGWTLEARRGDPVGYLRYSKEKLQKDLERIQTIIRDTEIQVRQVEAKHNEVKEDQGRYQELLIRAKNLYKEAEQDTESGYPVTFKNREYRQDEFKTQLEIIFNKDAVAKKQIYELSQSVELTRQALTKLHEKYARAQGALENIETTIIIAQANTSAAEVQRTLNQIAEVQHDIDIYFGDMESGPIPIRSVDDILAEDEAVTTNEEFESFLVE